MVIIYAPVGNIYAYIPDEKINRAWKKGVFLKSSMIESPRVINAWCQKRHTGMSRCWETTSR